MEKIDAFEIIANTEAIKDRVAAIQANLDVLGIALNGLQNKVKESAHISDFDMSVFLIGRLKPEQREKLAKQLFKS